MPTLTTTADRTAQTDRAGAGPLKLHTVNASRRRDLAAAIAGRRPVRRRPGAFPRLAMDPTRLAKELAAELGRSPRQSQEQVLDRVADGLMKELGW